MRKNVGVSYLRPVDNRCLVVSEKADCGAVGRGSLGLLPIGDGRHPSHLSFTRHRGPFTACGATIGRAVRPAGAVTAVRIDPYGRAGPTQRGPSPPNIDLHHFIKRDAVLAPVIGLGSTNPEFVKQAYCRHTCGLTS